MDTSEQYIKMCREAFPEDAEDGDELKTQDQLQEVARGYRGIEGLIKNFNDCVFFEGSYLFEDTYTMEQLWLVFVMKEKFGKSWSGSEWISEKD